MRYESVRLVRIWVIRDGTKAATSRQMLSVAMVTAPSGNGVKDTDQLDGLDPSGFVEEPPSAQCDDQFQYLTERFVSFLTCIMFRDHRHHQHHLPFSFY